MHSLYYDGKLVAIVVDPDAYPGGIVDLCHYLSPNEGLAHAVPVPATVDVDEDGNVHVRGAGALPK